MGFGSPPVSTGPLETDFLPGEVEGRLTVGEVRSDVPAAWRMLIVLAVAGLPLGALWTLVTPVEQVVLLPTGSTGTPTGEGDHAFDAIAVFVLALTVFGVVAGAVAWRMRRRRGPVLMSASVLGALVGGWLASRVGVWLAPVAAPRPVAVDRVAATAGEVTGPPIPATLTSVAPSPGPWWVALAAGLAAVLTYLVAAIAAGREDMARDDP